MATLTPVMHGDGRFSSVKSGPRRYTIDTKGLVRKRFPTVKALDQACEVYGLPKLANPLGTMGVNDLAILLELAERMHQPIDLYQYLVEVR
jgi:hypothetical protein